MVKRGAIFAPIFLATVMLLGRGRITTAGVVTDNVKTARVNAGPAVIVRVSLRRC